MKCVYNETTRRLIVTVKDAAEFGDKEHENFNAGVWGNCAVPANREIDAKRKRCLCEPTKAKLDENLPANEWPENNQG